MVRLHRGQMVKTEWNGKWYVNSYNYVLATPAMRKWPYKSGVFC
jgi:hypothetical protein